MDMEVTAWMSLYHAMNASDDRRPFSRATLRRIATFARPHRRQLAVFLTLSVVTAALAVATPVLAGRVVTAMVEGADTGTVTALAAMIAVIAVAEAGIGLYTRWLRRSPRP
jgi:ATP-binding cassette subfamily B protein